MTSGKSLVDAQQKPPWEPEISEEHEQSLQALSRALRATDFSGESRIKESLRSRLLHHAATQGRSYKPALPKKAVATFNRFAWSGLLLVFLLSAALNIREGALQPSQQEQLVTAYASTYVETEAGQAARLPTTVRVSTTILPQVSVTPGTTELAGFEQGGLRPSLAPLPVPPRP